MTSKRVERLTNSLFVVWTLLTIPLYGQEFQYPDYSLLNELEALDSLRHLYPEIVHPKDSRFELATLLVLGHYPELAGNKVSIKYKKKVRHPITASYSAGNMFRLRKKHKYVLLIKPGSFVDRIDINQQVALFGHEMAHFVYYRNRPTIGMLPWAFKYVFSKNFRKTFERDADYFALDHGLGWQYLKMSIYLSRQEVLRYMKTSSLYGL